ncbi:hypothetical protein EX30DRAFT_200578 [Ascodesmis nigricans]|uniref:Uncharacterized protein n=1 Tax=Ascodesmis nigricans TaxID=341454 RepID=A0A4S2MRF1_9PEZI|nr:hypothetical protein EX30DRAFT_200578 [Ascodesmis nigricans]
MKTQDPDSPTSSDRTVHAHFSFETQPVKIKDNTVFRYSYASFTTVAVIVQPRKTCLYSPNLFSPASHFHHHRFSPPTHPPHPEIFNFHRGHFSPPSCIDAPRTLPTQCHHAVWPDPTIARVRRRSCRPGCSSSSSFTFCHGTPFTRVPGWWGAR